MSLNKSQTAAVRFGKGTCLTLAGPGSGKTTVITNRIINLISEYHINPSNILVITFTKAAAMEMKARFQKMAGDRALPVSFGTFHAVFFQILKYAYHYNAANIVREEDRLRFFKEILKKEQKQFELEMEDEAEVLQGIQSEISKVKNERIALENYYSVHCPAAVFRRIFMAYQEFLQKRRLLDFDDMLVYCYELLSQREDILKLWQKKFQYILIDEFQDINKIQYDIVKMLALPENNLFIVGDDDQSIYRFRGANPSIMLNFEKDYPKAKRILLDVNYRCSSRILSASGNLISHNQERFQKKIQAFHGEGDPVFIRRFENVSKETESIARELLVYHQKGIPYSEMAILFRTNSQPGLLVQKLMELNIPFCMRDAMPNLYDHWIVKNIKAYLYLAMGSQKRQHYIEIMNRPNRYLSRDAFSSETVTIEDLLEYYHDKEWMQERIDKLQYDLAMLQGMAPYAAVSYIRKAIEYEAYLKEYAEIRNIKAEELFDLLDEVQERAKDFRSYEEWFDYMDEYKEELKKQAKKRAENKDGVVLSTMHASKGLEYRIVFIPDVNEGIIPHQKSVLDTDLEEERRLLYVAMTRAKERLHLYFSQERYNKQLEQSRFLFEILGMEEEGEMSENKMIRA